MSSYDEQIRHAIPCEIHAISGSADVQTSADVSNVSAFRLPDPAGRAGGALTSAFLKVVYRDGMNASWVETLRKIRTVLIQDMGFSQVPQLTSSRMMDVNKPMYIVPPGTHGGHRRAVLIGINYTGQQGQLSGCHNDVHNIQKYLVQVQKFNESEMLILMDDGKHHAPTKRNIEDAFRRITEYSQAGDVVFIHYSGHGGRVRDYSGDEDDGYDETLIPVDFQSAGQIIDDDISKILVKPMRAGVHVTALMDCCHSGTVLDLPYRFSADDTKMRVDQSFNLSAFGQIGAQVAIGCCIMILLQSLLEG
jgi:hypothetical protein